MARRVLKVQLLLVALLAAVVAFVIARFSECGQGLGVGLGQPSAPASSPEAPKDQPPGSDRSITVEGSKCTHMGKVHDDCEALCRRVMAEGAPDLPIEIQASKGSHGTVEALRKCLVDAGATAVEVRSE